MVGCGLPGLAVCHLSISYFKVVNKAVVWCVQCLPLIELSVYYNNATCMYVCVCIYVRTYVCMYVQYVYMYVNMYVCMYVCMYDL